MLGVSVPSASCFFPCCFHERCEVLCGRRVLLPPWSSGMPNIDMLFWHASCNVDMLFGLPNIDMLFWHAKYRCAPLACLISTWSSGMLNIDGAPSYHPFRARPFPREDESEQSRSLRAKRSSSGSRGSDKDLKDADDKGNSSRLGMLLSTRPVSCPVLQLAMRCCGTATPGARRTTSYDLA